MEVQDATTSARVAVALIDSDMAVRRAVQLRLQAGQFDVRAYASGWAMLAESVSRPDCIVVRDQMFEIDGFEVLRRLRERDWQGPAILVTNTPSLALATRAGRAGFDTVVDRPLVDDLMLHAVDQAMRAAPGAAS